MTNDESIVVEAPPQLEANDGLNRTEIETVSEAEARAIIERFLPDPHERTFFLTLLADSVAQAHATGTMKWGITLYSNRIWLNVGRVAVCTFQRGRGWLALSTNELPDHDQLEQSGLLTNGYKSIPGSIGIAFSSTIDPTLLESVRAAHDALITEAARQVNHVRGPSARAHSSSTLAYLRTTLRRSLPDPAYVSRLPDVDAATIEQALITFDAEKRGHAPWDAWEADRTFKYALYWCDQRYPIKEIVRLATGTTRTFNPEQAREYLQKRGFDIQPLRSTQPQVWIFQANPEQFPFATKLRDVTIGTQDNWAVTSYRQEIRAGDTVLFWQSGKAAGIYALGELISDPYQRDWTVDEQTVQRQPYQNAQWWIDYRYTRILEQPLSRARIKDDPLLSRMDIFKMSMGTNFRVLPEEWSKLMQLLNLNTPPSINVRDVLHQHLTARGLHFTPWQIATFYTALQAKGFVILSGISGTGKTKLAQHFAELLPQPGAAITSVEREDERIAITLKPYMFKYNRLIIPKQATRFFDPPGPGESKDVELTFEDQSQVCRLTHAVYGDTDYVALMLRGSAVRWFRQSFEPDDTLSMEPEFDARQDLIGFRLGNGAPSGASAPTAEDRKTATREDITHPTPVTAEMGTNWLFIPVRPDWRDSKSLLGYFNPLTGTYVWTDFLRFLVRAAQSYRTGERLAWFVILDEMNLARVEYYFADLLSVLESGRTADGWSREALRLDYPTTSDGDLPPHELRLPPNLSFIGTVNVDETTHAFSPKVLDRAFTIEFVEADFRTYPPVGGTTALSLTHQEQHDILRRFSQDGQFARVAKDRIAPYIAAHPDVRDHLQSLNTLLQPYSMHFGFRVFDEIVSFLAAAEENDLFDGLGEATAAFDAAVLMKVLPKFHGSRGKLEAPLRAVLAWCIQPQAPDEAALAAKLEQCETGHAAMQVLGGQTYRYPRTAERVARMVWALYTDGFASFG